MGKYGLPKSYLQHHKSAEVTGETRQRKKAVCQTLTFRYPSRQATLCHRYPDKIERMPLLRDSTLPRIGFLFPSRLFLMFMGMRSSVKERLVHQAHQLYWEKMYKLMGWWLKVQRWGLNPSDFSYVQLLNLPRSGPVFGISYFGAGEQTMDRKMAKF